MLSGVILAGGAHLGTKGVNRAFLDYGGEMLLDRQIREMRSCCDEITIVTEEPRQFLRSVDRDVRIVSDYYLGTGLLSGFHAGIALAGNEFVWMLGCHMPCPSADAAKLLQSRISGRTAAAIPNVRGTALPLHGVYRRSVSEISGKLLEAGRSDLSGLLGGISFIELEEKMFVEAGIRPVFARSVRTAEDYRLLNRDTPYK